MLDIKKRIDCLESLEKVRKLKHACTDIVFIVPHSNYKKEVTIPRNLFIQ